MTSIFYGATIGHIAKWSGTLASIPVNWQLCDGTNGTPDLRAKFVRGAPAGICPGSTGGSDSVTLTTPQLPSHNHSITDPQHFHKYVTKNGVSGCTCFNDIGNGVSSYNTSSSSTGITLGNAGSGGSHENRPQYYQVLFIMKVS